MNDITSTIIRCADIKYYTIEIPRIREGAHLLRYNTTLAPDDPKIGVLKYDFSEFYRRYHHNEDALSSKVRFKIVNRDMTGYEENVYAYLRDIEIRGLGPEDLANQCKWLISNGDTIEYLFWNPVIKYLSDEEVNGVRNLGIEKTAVFKPPKIITLQYFCEKSLYTKKRIT